MKKIAVVTGGGTGIGKACVKKLSDLDFFTVILYNKSKAEALRLCEELNKSGENAICVKADVTNYKEVKKAIDEVISLFGNIHVLVNNAGVAEQKLFTDISADDWDNMIASNLTSVFYMCKSVVPHMIKNHEGKIINISSIWGICGASCEVHYSASKAGVIGFSKALAQELGPSNITVNAIAPGVIDTKMNKNLSEEDYERLKEQTPLGKIGKPDDIAQCVAFLVSHGGDFITGQVISPNGGIVI